MLTSQINRRALLQALALAPAAGLSLTARAEAKTLGLISSDVCLVQPQLTEGPFYLDESLLRSDITAGRPGLPLAMRLQVVSADCAPIAGARVDVWHCDAAGVYSGVEGNTDTFLRGTVMTEADGVATFQTIFPGWYPGRVVHVHYKVFLPGGRAVLTSQLFFDDAFAVKIHANHPAYQAQGVQDTDLRADGIADRASTGAIARIEMDGDTARAALVVGVDTLDAAALTLWPFPSV